MKDNHIALVIVGACVFSWQVVLDGSLLAGLVAMAMTSCAFAGLYGATGYKAHRFFVISLALAGLTLLVGKVAL